MTGILLLVLAIPATPADALDAQPAEHSCGQLQLQNRNLDAALLRLGQHLSASIMFQHQLVAQITVGEHTPLADCRALLGHLVEASGLEVAEVADSVIVVRRARETPRRQHAEPEPDLPEPIAKPPRPAIDHIAVFGRSVTGSRLLPSDVEDAALADVIDRQYIDRSGHQSLAELLRYLPAISGNATSTFVTNGGDGSASLTLRGLPASNTLILLNGRRLNTDALRGEAADINSIPLAAVERVEILKDGASAIHGSDAIAGVVNIITRRNPRGLRAETYFGQSARGDLDTRHHSLLWGQDDERLSLMLGAEWYEQGAIMSRDRAISRSADDRERGGLDRRSSATAPARISLPQGPVILAEGDPQTIDGSSPTHFRPATGEDLYDFRADTTAVVPAERWGLFGEVNALLGNHAEWFAEVMYSRSRAANLLAPAPLFTGFEVLDLTIDADQAFNPFAQPLTDVRRRFVELPPREQVNRTRNLRAATGLNWRAHDTDMQAWLAFQESEASEQLRHVLDGPALQRALGPPAACAAEPDCRPLNLFGPPGSIDEAMLDAVRRDTELDARSRMLALAISGHRPLFSMPAGKSELALGLELRRESLRIEPDSRSQRMEVVAGNNQGPTRGSREVAEVHGEWLLPLAANLPGVDRLELLAAARASWYSDFGSTANPKLSLRYAPVPSVMLRGTWSRGFRAPGLRQLHLAEQQSFDTLEDPCAGPGALALPGCEHIADVTRTQFQTLTGGNPDLDPERSRSQTLGLMWTPAMAGGWLRVSMDYFRIRQRNVVDSSAQFIVNENARSGRFADRVIRDGSGNLVSVAATNLNLGGRDIRGVDFGLHWRSEPSTWGTVELAVNATHIDRFIDQVDPEAPPVDQAGRFRDLAAEGSGALPNWKANLGAHWHFGPWEASYHLFYVDSLEESIPGRALTRSIDAWHTHDVRLGYRFVSSVDLHFNVGVRNVFDASPPFAASAFNDSFDARTHDLAGRFLYARIAARLPGR
ncbi:MAG: TonB-dependent receptor [Gammaproteobacteria bacterium]|nr:TonB-dependent receptor [Gammaproteobacteria bacterium]